MKTAQRISLGAIAAAFVLPVLTGCGGAQTPAAEDCTPKYGEFETITEGVLTVATLEAMPYFSDVDGDPTGIDADFLSQFAEDSCLTVDWSVSPSAAVIQSVQSGRADVAAGGWYATAERGEIVNLSSPSYVELPTIFSTDGTADVQQLVNKSVGTVAGYTWVAELGALGMTLSQYQSTDAALADLAAGRIEYAVLGGIDGPYLLTQSEDYSDITSTIMEPDPAIDSSVNPSLPNYPATKGNDQLTNALNAALEEAHESGSLATTLESYGLDPALADVAQYE